MHTEHDVKINGGGDSATLRRELKSAIMELSAEDRYVLLREYAEKYGIKIHRFVKG